MFLQPVENTVKRDVKLKKKHGLHMLHKHSCSKTGLNQHSHVSLVLESKKPL